MKKTLIKISISFVLVLLLFSVGIASWVLSKMPTEADRELLKSSSSKDIPYLNSKVNESRGKVLAVVTSWDKFGETGKKTGYELTEISRAYYVLKVNGFEVDVASPKGGNPPMVLDPEDLGEFDYAFLNDPIAMAKVENSLILDQVSMADYEAVFFVGGKGAMWDFPGNLKIQELVIQAWNEGKVIGAVCHGPAALVDIELPSGAKFLDGRKVSSFSNAEELFIIPDAKEIFPFLLQSKIQNQKAAFLEGKRYLPNVVRDGKLVTGQNPWSTWEFSEELVKGLGYTPVPREKSAEENSLLALSVYHQQGIGAAKKMVIDLSSKGKVFDSGIIAMHWMVAVMDLNLGEAIGIFLVLGALY